MIDESNQIEFSERDRKVQSLIIIEGCANLLVLVVKLLVGLSTGSLAILADAIHSLTDLANNFVAWIVVRVSALPAECYNRIWCLKEFEVCGVPCWNRFCLAIESNKRSTPHMTNNTMIDPGTPEGIDPLR